jgi:hypothetical protein
VLGRTSTRCDALDRWLTPGPPCADTLDCDGGLCTRDQLAADTADWNELIAMPESDAGTRSEPGLPRPERTRLLAAYARGPLSRAVVLANDRRRYPYAGTDAGLLGCRDATLDAGALCSCSETTRDHDLCTLEPGATQLRWGACSIRVDDAHRRLEARRVCEGEGAKCNTYDRLCCRDLECDHDICRAKRANEGDATPD